MAKRSRRPRAANAALQPALSSETLQALELLPDTAFITDAESEALTRLSRTSLWRLERTEPLLKSVKLGPKRKVRVLGKVREFIRQRVAAAESAAAA